MEYDSTPADDVQPQPHEDHDRKQGKDSNPETSLRDLLDSEKELYPGASTWAPEEDRLFEILFLRQDLSLLPSHWVMDFRGVPMMGSIFQTSHEYPPIIYAHSRDFHATMALTRLIDVTSNARTICQSGLRHKAPSLIRDTIYRYVSWAAEDGGYQNLRYVPNITVATIGDSLDEEGITGFMQRHMRAFARLQREFLKEPRDADFWDVGRQASHGHLRSSRQARFSSHARLIKKYMVCDDDAKHESQTTDQDRSGADESMMEVTDDPGEATTDGTQHRAVTQSPSTRIGEELAAMDLGAQQSLAQDCAMDQPRHQEATNALCPDSDVTSDNLGASSESLDLDDTAPHAKSEQVPQYRRQPPVVYGFFVLDTTIFLVTLDSAKGEAADVSYHVDMFLTEVGQSVWNALTIGIAVCLARDELMTRTDDFEPLELVEESGPDA